LCVLLLQQIKKSTHNGKGNGATHIVTLVQTLLCRWKCKPMAYTPSVDRIEITCLIFASTWRNFGIC